jgi:glutamate dehydrogenase (NAD(P)+)
MERADPTQEASRAAFEPALVARIRDAPNGLDAIVVIDNVARGPAIGGVRMAPDIGRHAARFLETAGARLVAASDSGGAIHDPEGIAVAALEEAKRARGSVAAYARGKKLSREELFEAPHDILIPAARPDSIHEQNAGRIPVRLILEGANIPATPAAEAALARRGAIVVPDFIANAGGVICAALEYHGGSQSQAFAAIAEKIRPNTEEVLSRSRAERILPREAAERLAWERVEAAMAYRRGSA